jgi:hypothetical protein
MNRSRNLWHALEAIPALAAVEAEWRAQIGSQYESAKAFLRPNGKIAQSYPCTIPRGCGCEHEIVKHGPEDIVAVCRCERGCETFSLNSSEIVLYELDRSALDGMLVEGLGLLPDSDTRTDLYGTTRIGVYVPYAGYRFPVFLTIQIEPTDFSEIVDGLLVRNEKPFILLAPTRELCPPQAEKRLTDKQSCFFPLSEIVSLGDKRRLHLIRPIDDILSQFRSANLPIQRKTESKVFFPAPKGTIWENINIRFVDGHTVTIRVGDQAGRFNYTQMGMANKKNTKFTKQWELFMLFAKGKGRLDWSSSDAHFRWKKQKEQLSKRLSEFFHLEDDPIRWEKNEKAYRCRFRILPEGEEDY